MNIASYFLLAPSCLQYETRLNCRRIGEDVRFPPVVKFLNDGSFNTDKLTGKIVEEDDNIGGISNEDTAAVCVVCAFSRVVSGVEMDSPVVGEAAVDLTRKEDCISVPCCPGTVAEAHIHAILSISRLEES